LGWLSQQQLTFFGFARFKGMIHAARSCLISIKNWLILPSCSICGQFSPEYLLCPECLKKLDDDRLEFSDDSGVCNLPGLGAVPVLSLFCTSSFSKKLIHQIKYSGKTRLIDALVNQSGVLPDLAGWTLVPVPLHPCRKRERGFNQAALIAGCIAKNCGGIVRNDWLERSIATNSQTGKDKTGRFKNMNNVFRLSAKARSEMPGFRGKILIVDDVITTGATLGACAEVILKTRRGGEHTFVISFFSLLKTDVFGNQDDFWIESQRW